MPDSITHAVLADEHAAILTKLSRYTVILLEDLWLPMAVLKSLYRHLTELSALLSCRCQL